MSEIANAVTTITNAIAIDILMIAIMPTMMDMNWKNVLKVNAVKEEEHLRNREIERERQNYYQRLQSDDLPF